MKKSYAQLEKQRENLMVMKQGLIEYIDVCFREQELLQSRYIDGDIENISRGMHYYDKERFKAQNKITKIDKELYKIECELGDRF